MAHASCFVLLVDDDEDLMFLQRRRVLRAVPNAEVLTAASGSEALTVLVERQASRQSLPTHLLLDLQMPHMDGFEFLDAYRKLPTALTGGIRVTVVTGSRNPEDISRAEAYDEVQEVIDKADIGTLIGRVVGG